MREAGGRSNLDHIVHMLVDSLLVGRTHARHPVGEHDRLGRSRRLTGQQQHQQI